MQHIAENMSNIWDISTWVILYEIFSWVKTALREITSHANCAYTTSTDMWYYYHLKPLLYCSTITVRLGPEKLFFPTSDQWITLTGVRAIYHSVCRAGDSPSLPQGPAACHQTHAEETLIHYFTQSNMLKYLHNSILLRPVRLAWFWSWWCHFFQSLP